MNTTNAPNRTNTPDEILARSLASLDVEALRADYLEQGEFLKIEKLLPESLLAQWQQEVKALLPAINRNRVPWQKKGGSVGCNVLRELAPTIYAVYSSEAFFSVIAGITGSTLQYCPDSDLHGCALYAYREPGDYIDWHYDTSFYRGQRYTVLVGVVDDSDVRLEYKLHTRDDTRKVAEGSAIVEPGSLVVFDGDRLYHRTTRLGEGHQRLLIAMEFVTDTSMNPFMRLVSNVKDAVAYFGWRSVFSPNKGRRWR